MVSFHDPIHLDVSFPLPRAVSFLLSSFFLLRASFACAVDVFSVLLLPSFVLQVLLDSFVPPSLLVVYEILPVTASAFPFVPSPVCPVPVDDYE